MFGMFGKPQKELIRRRDSSLHDYLLDGLIIGIVRLEPMVNLVTEAFVNGYSERRAELLRIKNPDLAAGSLNQTIKDETDGLKNTAIGLMKSYKVHRSP